MAQECPADVNSKTVKVMRILLERSKRTSRLTPRGAWGSVRRPRPRKDALNSGWRPLVDGSEVNNLDSLAQGFAIG
jgi:hypothetical protein